MTEKILLGEDARKAIKEGVDAVANPVALSLGARGKNIIIAGSNKSSKDGYRISKAIEFSNPTMRVGSEMVKEVAKETVRISGDATTTATVLAQAIVKEGFKLLSAGHRGTDLKRGIDSAVLTVIEGLKEMSQPVEIGNPKLLQIASISANNDETVGKMVVDAFEKTGKDGVRSLDDSKTGSTYLDVKEGLVFERGWLHQLFINNFEKLSCQLDDCLILICEGKLHTKKEVINILSIAAQAEKSLLIIAEDFDGDGLYIINTSRVKGGSNVCLVRAPGFGDNQKELLKDIAAVTGANIANDENGLRLDKVELKDFGTADKILVTKEETTIVGGGGKKPDINERVSFIKNSLNVIDANDTYGKMLLEQRLAKLTGGVAVIYVGAPTETEQSELKDRYDDSLRATFCAIEEGIVCGGGIALIRCIEKLNNLVVYTDDELAGVKLIQKVLEYPFIQMAKNADLENRITVGDVLKQVGNYGYNFKTDKFEDLMESGVVDPLKVVRVALINAASFAGTLLTTEALIVPEKEDANANFIPPHLRR